MQGLTEIYSVTSKLKTIADQMLLKSVPIPNFEKYLGLALELKVKYGETNPLEDKIIEDIDDVERKRINEQRHNFKKKLENIKKNQLKLKNITTDMQNTLEGINSKLGDTEEHISDLEDRE